MHYPSQRLSKFGQIEMETVRGPLLSKMKLLQNVSGTALCDALKMHVDVDILNMYSMQLV